MNKNLCNKIGEVNQDNLIAGAFPRALTFGVKLAQNQGVLERGTVLSLDEDSGLYTKLSTDGLANCILADAVDTGNVPEDQTQETTLVAKYQSQYTAAGITVEGGKIVYKPTGEIAPAITHNGYVYVGLTFTKPADATAVIITDTGKVLKGADGQDKIYLNKDSDDVIDGNPVVYFSVVPVGSTEQINKIFNLSFTWFKADGSIISTTTFAAARFVGDYVAGVAYRTGHFNRRALIMEDGYALTVKDTEELRKGGIFLSDME